MYIYENASETSREHFVLLLITARLVLSVFYGRCVHAPLCRTLQII